MKIEKYEDFNIWKLSIELIKKIYKITTYNSYIKDYSLKDQIRRATISISCNIVEGFERNNNNEFIQYLRISKGSIGEVKNLLFISLELNYLNKNEYLEINEKIIDLSNQIGKFISYLMKKRKNKEFIHK